MPREINLYDTQTGELQTLSPREPGKVGIYACGPTVYGRIHIGNGRPYVVFSLLKRFLEHEGYSTTFVANITDINDKIYVAATQAKVPSEELAREMTEVYVRDTDSLGLGRPDQEPKASETLGPIISLIETLIEREHAYEVDGDVYFDVRSYGKYGELSHRDVDQMDQGEGVEGASRKRDPLDFALWKRTKDDEDTCWPSPWGEGRPGWHIECSAMAEEVLGTNFEIHGGGIDLVFPHHENECAQTAAARGEPLAQIWMHNGMVRFDGEKMAKSVGNIRLLHEVVEEYGRDAVVIYFLGGHYRQPIVFSGERLEEAKAQVSRIKEVARATVQGESPNELASLRDAFFAALADDFNTPKALAALFDWIREVNRSKEAVGDSHLREMLAVCGLENLLERQAEASDPELLDLLKRREEARADRDFAEADRIRDLLAAKGWTVRDGADGPELVPVS